MLEHSREYTDGKYVYAVIPVKNVGNIVILENELSGKTLKKYFTEDDESAIAIFESMIECQFNEGDEMLHKYKVGERLSGEYSHRVKVEVE